MFYPEAAEGSTSRDMICLFLNHYEYFGTKSIYVTLYIMSVGNYGFCSLLQTYRVNDSYFQLQKHAQHFVDEV